MKRVMAFGFALLLGAADPPPRVEALAWIAGSWAEQKGDAWTEENWTDPRGGVLLGTNRSGEGEGPAAYEYMRIGPGKDGVLTFYGSPEGAPPVAFPLVTLEGQSAVFENPEHDYPVRIRYWRQGDLLKAEVSGADGANALGWTFRRK